MKFCFINFSTSRLITEYCFGLFQVSIRPYDGLRLFQVCFLGNKLNSISYFNFVKFGLTEMDVYNELKVLFKIGTRKVISPTIETEQLQT